jgi:hypothetical protein
LGADAPASFDSAEAAVDALMTARGQTNQPAESAEDATADEESPDEGDAAQPEEAATGETQEDDPAKEPPLDLPRSWTKEQAETWSKLDRATQEYLLEHDRKISEGVRRSQNELAEQRKALEAELGKAKQLQTEYEGKLPQLVKTLETALQNEFSDIQTMNDVRKLQAEDPFRFQQWQLRQMELAEVTRQQNEIKAREAQEAESNWKAFVGEQSKKLAEFVPDAEVSKYAPKAGDLFASLGFTESEREGFLKGDKISLFDHRMQRLVLNALKYEEIQNAPKVAVKPNLPPVQKPGTARPAGAERAASLQSLSEKLSSSGSEEDALQLLLARRAAASRRAS